MGSTINCINTNINIGFRFSVSNDLKYDAERDLKDIGAKHVKVFPLNKVRYCVMFRKY